MAQDGDVPAEEHEDLTSPEPIGPVPLLGRPDHDTSFAAAGGGGFLALALAKGLRAGGRARTASIVLIAVFVLGLAVVLVASVI